MNFDFGHTATEDKISTSRDETAFWMRALCKLFLPDKQKIFFIRPKCKVIAWDVISCLINHLFFEQMETISAFVRIVAKSVFRVKKLEIIDVTLKGEWDVVRWFQLLW